MEEKLKNKNDAKSAKVGASLLSALSGNPNGLDHKHNRIRHFISSGRYAQNIQAFSITNESPPEGVKPYKVTWVKSPHGVYVLTRTNLPLNIKGKIKNVPGYVLMFSQHPSFLARLFLWRDNEGNVIPSAKEIEARTTVIAARYEHDILQANRKTGRKHLVTSWMKTAINSHTVTFERLLKRHGSITRDGENLLRSGSSIIVLRPTKENPDLYKCLYYGNPTFGQVSLFMNERALASRAAKLFFKMAAIELDMKPLPKDEAYLFAHKTFAEMSRDILRLKDPYHLDDEEKFWPKIKRKVYTGMVRTMQSMAHHGANINIKKLTTTLSISGAIIFFTQIPALLLAANSAKSNVILKTAQSAGRAAGKFLAPVSSITVNALNDVSALVASHVKNNYITDEVRGLIPNANFMKHMTAMPIDFMPNTYPDVVPYTKKHEREWARAVLLDTLGIQPGTIYSEVDINGQDFLLAEQPNGLNIYYDPEQLVAFAHKVREPFEYSSLEKPIQLLFDEMSSEHNFIGLRRGKNGKIAQENFTSLNDIPKRFNGNESYSIQSLHEKGMNLEDIRTSDYFPLMEILPKVEAKKQQKQIDKAINAFFRAAGNGYVFNPEEQSKQTIDISADIYVRKHTVPSNVRSLSSFKTNTRLSPPVLNTRAIKSRIPKV